MALDGTPDLSDMFAKKLASYCVLRSRLDRDDLVEEDVACAYRFAHRAAVERDRAAGGNYRGMSLFLFMICTVCLIRVM